MKKYIYPVSAFAIFSVIFWSLPVYQRSSEVLQRLTANTRDFFFKIRKISADVPRAADGILIVSIDEESCQRLKARWPWSRKTLALVTEALHKRGAKLIGFNLSFTGLENDNDASTEAFAAAAAAHGSVVVGASFDKKNRLIPPHGSIGESAARYGYLEKILDPDLTIRRSYLIRVYAGSGWVGAPAFESSFPLELAATDRNLDHQISSGGPFLDADANLTIPGDPVRKIRVDPAGIYSINYLAEEKDLQTISAWKLLEGKAPDALVRGKTVLVGLTSSLFADNHRTPIGIMPGVLIHANEFLAIEAGRQLRFVPDWICLWISYLTALGIFGLFLARRLWLGTIAVFLGATSLFIIAQAAFLKDVVIEPFLLLLGPVLAAAAGFLVYLGHLLLDNRGLEMKMTHDKMTGLYTYEHLRSRLEIEWALSKKDGHPVSVVMTDLDRFKKINDTLGHEAGNRMILRAAEVIRESARGYDVVARYGGDEFVILLWRTGRQEAEKYRLRLRELYHRMAEGLEPALKDSSISIGLASFDPALNPDFPESPQRLIEEADKDLFNDKEKRRSAR